MQLPTEYREKTTSYSHKDFYLICKVGFSHEELAVAQERGMWDKSITVYPDEPEVTSGHQAMSKFMTFCAIALILIGLVSACMAAIAPAAHRTDAPPWWLVVIFLITGFTLAMWAVARRGDAQLKGRYQTLTISRLTTNGTFQVHANSLQQAKEFELEIKEQLTGLANGLRKSTVVPEQNTYEL